MHNEKKEEKQILTLSQAPVKQDSARVQSLTFFDSIEQQDKLSFGQIRSHTRIDNSYYSEIFANATFTGDTVFKIGNGYKAAVIKYYDSRACIYKFLLIYNTEGSINIGNRIIYSDCDRDGLDEYTVDDYRFLTDSTFELIESYFHKGSNRVTETIKVKWKIDNRGVIDSLR
jgi:hypothetical protein